MLAPYRAKMPKTSPISFLSRGGPDSVPERGSHTALPTDPVPCPSDERVSAMAKEAEVTVRAFV